MVVEGVKRRQISPQAGQNTKKDTKNGKFPALFLLKITENAVFCSKVLNKTYSQDVSSGKH
jgi:hypothetical protein